MPTDIEKMKFATEFRPCIEISITKRSNNSWVVIRHNQTLNKDGDWEFESLPSNRDAEYIARSRYATLDEAWSAYEKYVESCGLSEQNHGK